MVSKASRRHIVKLADAAHGIVAPFVCDGVAQLEQAISIRFASGPPFEVLPSSSSYDQERRNEPLVRRMTPARFGRGKRSMRDAEVRDGLQLNAEGGAFTIEGFDPEASGVLKTIRRKLLSGAGRLEAELYSLNLYPNQGHFRPHKDTPRSGSMLGTLVACLPSQFSNGQLIVVHRGAFRMLDWGQAIRENPDPRTVHWAAFFGDVDHAIERVWSGHRLTATWLLRHSEAARTAQAGEGEDLFGERLRKTLALRGFLPPGGTLAFPCFHMYSSDRGWSGWNEPLTESMALRLKGRDQVIARAALALGLETRLVPYMIETCADESWQLERFPSKKEVRRLGHRVERDDLEEKLPLGKNQGQPDPKLIWVFPPPHFNKPPHFYEVDRRGAPIFAEVPSLEYLHECEYSDTGYFGNEGGDLDFYLYAALQVTIPQLADRSA